MEDYRHKIPWGVGWVKEPGGSNKGRVSPKSQGDQKSHTETNLKRRVFLIIFPMYNRERARVLVIVSSLFYVLRSRILLPLKGVAQVSTAICSNKIKRFLPGKSHNVHHISFNSCLPGLILSRVHGQTLPKFDLIPGDQIGQGRSKNSGGSKTLKWYSANRNL